jgi:hypothetical protein
MTNQTTTCNTRYTNWKRTRRCFQQNDERAILVIGGHHTHCSKEMGASHVPLSKPHPHVFFLKNQSVIELTFELQKTIVKKQKSHLI